MTSKRLLEEDDDEGIDYDDVIAYAKEHGRDPYLGNDEYNPSVIEWASAALSRERDD